MHKTKHLAGWGHAIFGWMTAVTLVLWASGWVMFLLPDSEWMDLAEWQQVLRRSSGVTHGVLAWAFCVMFGRGVWPHVRVMWHRHTEPRKWLLGLANLGLLVLLGLGGLVLLYGTPAMHDWMSPVHFWLGAGIPLIYLAHTAGRLRFLSASAGWRSDRKQN